MLNVNSKKSISVNWCDETGNEKQMICQLAYRCVDRNDTTRVSCISSNKPTFIIPAGYRGYEWYSMYGGRLLNIVGFIDNNVEKQGDMLLDKEIYSLEKAVQLSKLQRITVILTSKYYHRELLQLLEEYKDNMDILDGDRVLWVDSNGTLYYYRG